jgi:predicted RND superfamily exporter protein
LQTRRPWAVVVGFALLVGLAARPAIRLRLVTDFADLLPQNQPSVVELRNILARTRGLSSLYVVLEGGDPMTLRRVADALVAPLSAIGSPYVESAHSGVQEARKFLLPRAGLFLSENDLDDLEGELTTREHAAFSHAIGADLDDEEVVPASAKTGDEQSIEKRLSSKVGALDRFPDGYYQATLPEGTVQVVVVRAALATGDITGGRAALDRVQAVVNNVLAGMGEPARTVHAGYAGDLVTSMAEYDLVRRDVLDVGGVGVALVLAVVVLFFRTPRALLALGVSIAAGTGLTFGLTGIVLGHLNVATAFLFSIVAGNGVNFGIIWLARFVEERRAGQVLVTAVTRALERTFGATLTAACAAATAYAALGIGRFRGFRHFALIGGTGMLICWAVSYTLLPAVVVLLERRRARSAAATVASRGSSAFTHLERPFVWLVARAPRVTLAVSLAVGLGALVACGHYFWRGPLEYDMHHLQSDRDTTGELYRVSHLASQVLSPAGGAGMVVLTERPSDTPVLAAILRKKRDAAPPGMKPFQDVHTLDDMVPPNQVERLERVRKVGKRLTRDHERGAIEDASWNQIAPLLPPPEVTPFGVADLPDELTAPFTEKDGTRGRILYIEQAAGQSDADLHYLLRWAAAFRSTRLPDGRVVVGSGRAVIFADLLNASLIDMPRSVILSLALTAIAVIFLFRRAQPVALVVGSLLLALVYMLGAMGAANVRLSFINFIALPITFGIGVDYPVNVYRRFEQDRRAGILAAMRGVGGAVILCSLTTSLGYLALLRAHNQAVRSLGAVAVLGEVSCLTAALLALPAAVAWSERRRRSRFPVDPD